MRGSIYNRHDMKRILSIVALIACIALSARADLITVALYSTFSSELEGGAPYSGFVADITAADVMFGTDNGFYWFPLGLTQFGADITGALLIPSTASYTFSLESDDGSVLLIDNALVVDHGGPSPILDQVTGTTTLSAGVHPFEVQFFECCAGHSGVDLTLPPNVAYTAPAPTAEPPTLALLFSAGAIVLVLRKRTGLGCAPPNSGGTR